MAIMTMMMTIGGPDTTIIMMAITAGDALTIPLHGTMPRPRLGTMPLRRLGTMPLRRPVMRRSPACRFHPCRFPRFGTGAAGPADNVFTWEAGQQPRPSGWR